MILCTAVLYHSSKYCMLIRIDLSGRCASVRYGTRTRGSWRSAGGLRAAAWVAEPDDGGARASSPGHRRVLQNPRTPCLRTGRLQVRRPLYSPITITFLETRVHFPEYITLFCLSQYSSIYYPSEAFAHQLRATIISERVVGIDKPNTATEYVRSLTIEQTSNHFL